MIEKIININKTESKKEVKRGFGMDEVTKLEKFEGKPTLTLIFDTPEDRENFTDWLSNTGEQVYWQDMELLGKTECTISYARECGVTYKPEIHGEPALFLSTPMEKSYE